MTELIEDICNLYDNTPSALLEVLHDLQSAYDYLSDDTLTEVASILNLSRAEVYGVVSFYHDFKRAAPKQTVFKVCGAEACQAVGCRSLIAYAKEQCAAGHYTDSEVEVVYCLGNCALGPAVMIDNDLHGRVDVGTLDILALKALMKTGAVNASTAKADRRDI